MTLRLAFFGAISIGPVLFALGGSNSGQTVFLAEECEEPTPTPVATPTVSPLPSALPYPTRGAMRIKAIQPDFWPNPDEISGNNAGGVAMNLVWDLWESTVVSAPCDSGQEEYDGHCFQIDPSIDHAIRDYTNRGLVVTAIVYGVPQWAQVDNTNCTPIAPGYERFCAPDDSADYGRFAGMIARRYNGKNGNGRLADFVIHNEVNANDWYDIGCGQGTACDPAAWVSAYARDYRAAYTQIKYEQSTAKVLISFQHDFDESLDNASANSPILSVQTFTRMLAPKISDLNWQIAYHPYAPSLLYPEFSAFDLPHVTYGNIGVILGWLRSEFPNDPHAWAMQLTESGINSAAPYSTEAAQADAVCDSFRTTLGTPGIHNYVYHRMWDNSQEGGLALGLARVDGTLKPSWSVWALANRADVGLSCGFENLPYTRLARGIDGSGRHWVTSRLLPPGFVEESTTGWKLFRDEEADTTLLFECAVGEDHSFMSSDVNCEGQRNMGPVGWISDTPQSGTIPLYRCTIGGGTDHFVSPDANCEGQTTESLLGYALPE